MSKKILVIDDDQILRKLVKALLEKNNFEVVMASNGVDGIVQWKKESPDLIILDISMPMMDGYTFIQETKAMDELGTVPIIMLTSKEDLRDVFRCEGVKDYLVKPYNNEELLNKINKILG